MNHSSVLIVSDDTEFARTVAARWRAERQIPEITIVASDVWRPSSVSSHHLVIVGPVRSGKRSSILSALDGAAGVAAIYVADDEKDVSALQAEYAHLLVVPRQDGWVGTLILVSIEALRRVDALARAYRAERLARACQGDATLGRYMLEVRPSVNNALTSVLGNADLLLLDPIYASGERGEQIRAVQVMALRLNEIMHRFSSLASEMRTGEKESQAETDALAEGILAKPEL